MVVAFSQANKEHLGTLQLLSGYFSHGVRPSSSAIMAIYMVFEFKPLSFSNLTKGFLCLNLNRA